LFASWQADCLAVQKEKKAEKLMSSDEDSSGEGQMQAPKKAKHKVSTAACLLVGKLIVLLCWRLNTLQTTLQTNNFSCSTTSNN
jgi:hypothetical protein